MQQTNEGLNITIVVNISLSAYNEVLNWSCQSDTTTHD